MPKIKFDFALSKQKQLLSLIANPENTLQPDFTTVDRINKPEVYKRLTNITVKEQYRKTLLLALKSQWSSDFGAEKAENFSQDFIKAVQTTDENGALIFADLIARNDFTHLVTTYDQLLKQYGSNSWIHSYLNLGNHPEFLNNEHFNHAFLHPLLIAVISYQIGGAIRIVDARAKNAEPISVKAQDNMLHIDNTPFNDEYKIIVTWEKNKASGPKGQNFVIIPGTHKGIRNCFYDKNGDVFSTENGSIFIKPDTVQQVFDIQKKVFNSHTNTVVEVTDKERPLTTLFAAGSLVHHRYRTDQGYSRSCMILAFHRAADNPGQFIGNRHLEKLDINSRLNALLFGQAQTDHDAEFIDALCIEANKIAGKLDEIYSTNKDQTGLINPGQKQLDNQQLEAWKKTVTSAPSIEDLKRQQLLSANAPFKLKNQMSMQDIGKQLMMMDKHGPLDLILYPDSHEEIRKWARNRIREMKEEKLIERLQRWEKMVVQPCEEQILSPEMLKEIAEKILKIMETLSNDEKRNPALSPLEKITPEDAYRSVYQLVMDLKEAISRCDTAQTFLSTSLFIFWTLDETAGLYPGMEPSTIEELGQPLLQHYLATAVLVAKQLLQKNEQKLSAHRNSLFNMTGISDNELAASSTSSFDQTDAIISP